MFKKTTLTIISCLFMGSFIFAQNVGIGTATPNASAKLDITDANRGLLIPRVSIGNIALAAPVTAPATSLLVYNTNAAVTGGSGVGFYYWSGTQWVKLDTGNGDWKLLGNAGTVAATNFLGTTDAVDLVFRTNNTEKVRILSAGNVGVGTATPAASARLDITSSNQGILLPRVALTATNLAGPVTAPATSLMVYNTATAGAGATAVSPGFYYWDAAQWVRFDNGNDWKLVGNAGTNAASNFVGTTDAVDFVTRTNNTEKMRVTSVGNVGIGVAAPAASALLDITSTNQGLLIPRVALTAANVAGPVTSPATSLMVYNTATAGTSPNNVSPGHYYWDGARWQRYATNAWNVGTSTATTNNIGAAGTIGYFGTTSNSHIDFVSNNIVRGRISNVGEFFIGATVPVLPGTLMNGVANAALPWAVNGYSAFDGGAVYGSRLSGAIGAWGSGQFEIQPGMNVATARGVYGIVNNTAQFGVNGIKPAGGTGWGGLFQNDLGYTGFFGAASDRSLKKNIQPLNGALGILSQLPIYSYQYKTEEYDVLGDGGTHYGVMADELKQLVPALVKSKSLASGSIRSLPSDQQPRGVEGTVDLVNYIELIPITIQAIKEQQQLINEQKELIKQMQIEINLLKEKK